MNGLELYDRLRLLRDAAADNAYMMGDERERGMYDGYGEVMRRCLELPEADVEDWIYGFTHAIRESGDTDTEYARGRGIAMDCLTSSPRLKPGDSLHKPDSKGTSGLRK